MFQRTDRNRGYLKSFPIVVLLTLLLYLSSFFPSFHFLALEGFWISSQVFVNRSWDSASRKINIGHSSFWRHQRILWFHFFEDGTVKTIAIYEETPEEQKGSQRQMNHYGENEKWCIYQDSKHKEEPEFGLFTQSFSIYFLLNLIITSYAFQEATRTPF